jgi:hypothetical protein
MPSGIVHVDPGTISVWKPDEVPTKPCVTVPTVMKPVMRPVSLMPRARVAFEPSWKRTNVPSGWRRNDCVIGVMLALPTTWPALLIPCAIVKRDPGGLMSV